MKKIYVTSTLVILFTTLSFSMIANAEVYDSPNEDSVNIVTTLESNNPQWELDAGKQVKTMNQTIDLLVTFTDPNNQKIRFKHDYSSELEALKEKYSLELFTDANVEDYYNSTMNEYNPDSKFNQEHIRDMLSFFDIFENMKINRDIITNIHKFEKTEDSNYLEEAKDLSPTMSEKVSKIQSNRSLTLPSYPRAVIYAKKYASNYNPAYGFFRADCTHFLSQIMIAGGIGQVRTGNENTGWWYDSTSKRSISWVRADVFSRYMGRRYYGSFNSIKPKLSIGDTIGVDFTGDGTIDHLAFISDKDFSKGDIEIAQHSSNYLKYSRFTNWPNERYVYMIR